MEACHAYVKASVARIRQFLFPFSRHVLWEVFSKLNYVNIMFSGNALRNISLPLKVFGANLVMLLVMFLYFL